MIGLHTADGKDASSTKSAATSVLFTRAAAREIMMAVFCAPAPALLSCRAADVLGWESGP